MKKAKKKDARKLPPTKIRMWCAWYQSVGQISRPHFTRRNVKEKHGNNVPIIPVEVRPIKRKVKR